MNKEKTLEAFSLIQNGQAQEGMNVLREEFLKNPNDWNVHYHTGMAWRMIGDLDRAILSYKKAIELCPVSEIAGHINYYGLGIAFQLKGELDNAIINLCKAHEIDKTSVQVLNSLGLTYKKKGDIQKALEIYDLAAQTMMKNIFEELIQSGHDPINVVSEDNNKIAVMNPDAFNRVPDKLKQDNLYCILQNNIGVCYAELGIIDEARKAFSESIQFIPDGMKYDAPFIALQQLDEE